MPKSKPTITDLIVAAMSSRCYEPEMRNKDGVRWIRHRFPIKGGITLRDVQLREMSKNNALFQRLTQGKRMSEPVITACECVGTRHCDGSIQTLFGADGKPLIERNGVTLCPRCERNPFGVDPDAAVAKGGTFK